MYYDQAILLNPDFLPAKNNKANALANLKNYDDAIILYEEILKENPHYSTAQKNLNIALSQKPVTQNVSEDLVESDLQKIVYSEQSKNEIKIPKQEQRTTNNFFDEVGLVFSSFGSLFGFLN